MIAILMLLISANTAIAEYVQIGEENLYTMYWTPEYGDYKYGWSECIYNSLEIGPEPIDITAISYCVAYYNYGVNERIFHNQQIYMSLTTDAVYSFPLPTRSTEGKTLVYDGDVHWDGLGWQTITLDTPFYYDGTSNLRIMWDNWDGSNTGNVYWDAIYTNEDIRNILCFSDTVFPSECPGGWYSYRVPIIRLHYEPVPPISIYFDIKPGSCPNPFNLYNEGVLPVAILGTEEFDVTTIDPATIEIKRSGCKGTVSPLRWDYEDVGTPYTGDDECGCHELENDGILDLTLKFDSQELINKLDLNLEAGNTIPIIIEGELKDEYNSFRIEGQDCIWIVLSHDVGVTQIISPENDIAGILTPEVKVHNFGTKKENNVPVNMIINKNNYEPLLSEDFSSGIFPPTGWTNTYPHASDYWHLYYSNIAGGTLPEARFFWGYDVDVFRLYTYPIDTTGLSSVNIEFKHYVNHFGGPYTLHVETSTDGVNWNSIWSIVNPTSDIGPDTISITTNEGVGSSTFYVAFTYEGDSYNIDYWHIDDIFISEFFVTLEYDETEYVNIKPGETINLMFPEWTPSDWQQSENVYIDYSISACTTIHNDVYPWNDCSYKDITLYYPYFYDVGVVNILHPNSGPIENLPVEITIENMGQFQDESFYTNVQIKRTGIPAGWTQVNYGGDENFIHFEYGSHSYEPPGSGNYYVGAWDYPNGAYGSWDIGLFTPALNLTGLSTATLVYDRNFQDYAGRGHFAVRTYSGGTDVSNFEEQLYFRTSDDIPYTGIIDATHIFDPSTYTDPSEVYIEWWYTDENALYAWGLSIDNVEIPEIGFSEGFETGEELVYDETVNVVFNNVAYGETINVVFPNWTTTSSGTFNITACTQLVGDGDSSNDCMEKEIILEIPSTSNIKEKISKLIELVIVRLSVKYPILKEILF
jgi:hypothetical protein